MTPSSSALDNHYYDVAADPSAYPRQRLLFSDRLLSNGSATAGMFERFRTGQAAWVAAFAAQYQEMTLLGVSTGGSGYGLNDGWRAPAFYSILLRSLMVFTFSLLVSEFSARGRAARRQRSLFSAEHCCAYKSHTRNTCQVRRVRRVPASGCQQRQPPRILPAPPRLLPLGACTAGAAVQGLGCSFYWSTRLS